LAEYLTFLMDHTLFYQLTGVLLLAGLIAIFTSLLKQPSIIAFILTGLIVGPFGYYQFHQSAILNNLGEIGIALLLFMVGLEMDVKQLKAMGKVSVYTGLGQILFTSTVGFLIVKILGYSTVEAVYIALALTFSSTIVVVKLLNEKKETQSLYARIVVGFLVVQDLVAMVILLFIGGGAAAQEGMFSGLPLWQTVIITLVKALFLILILIWLSRKVFPKLLRYLGKSDELLLSFALAWALGLAALVSLPQIGFSIEMGGFLAGLALANSQAHWEISARIKSIRDFFIIIFFIVFGTQLVLGDWHQIMLPAIILSIFVLIGNPLLMMLIMGWLGYKPRTSFFAAVTTAQVSEFSFILVALGASLGHVQGSTVGLITLVGVVTIGLSSYMMLYSHRLYEWLKGALKVFDFKKGSAEKNLDDVILKKHIILVGAHRLGSHLIHSLRHSDHPLVIVDFDPEISEKYAAENIVTICGDITDPYIQDQLNIPDAKLVISTIPEYKDNIALLDAIEKRTDGRKTKPRLIFAAQSAEEAKRLYEREIDYAISPHFIGGLHLAKILEDDNRLITLRQLKKHHLKVLEEDI
jgi:Kef-type K+ transport system membrane component KefB/Trk K+ transport system NAD-binding subunit